METTADERVFVSWHEHWALSTYVDRYFNARRIRATPALRARIAGLLGAYRGRRPYTKADLDYYLDANLGR